MSLIILEDAEGNRRTVAPGPSNRRPGERVVGIEKSGRNLIMLAQERNTKFTMLAHLFGMGLADFITFAAKVFGVKPCAFCEMRRLILHRMGEIGIRKSMWLLLKTFNDQFGKNLGFSLAKKIIVAGCSLIGGKSNGTSSN